MSFKTPPPNIFIELMSYDSSESSGKSALSGAVDGSTDGGNG